MKELSHSDLVNLLDYSPETGIFTWKYRAKEMFISTKRFKTWNTRYAGKMAGGIDGRGYLQISIFGKLRSAHRLAWIYVNGSAPEGQIDHINHNRLDNRIINLRVVTPLENTKNRKIRADNTSGVSGVYWNKKSSAWHVQLRVNGKHVSGGLFMLISEAAMQRDKLSKRLGFHKNHGLPQ
jgi:hypothetical protein